MENQWDGNEKAIADFGIAGFLDLKESPHLKKSQNLKIIKSEIINPIICIAY
jgi:hypothetical protein